jgi:hypothetical protein
MLTVAGYNLSQFLAQNAIDEEKRRNETGEYITGSSIENLKDTPKMSGMGMCGGAIRSGKMQPGVGPELNRTENDEDLNIYRKALDIEFNSARMMNETSKPPSKLDAFQVYKIEELLQRLLSEIQGETSFFSDAINNASDDQPFKNIVIDFSDIVKAWNLFISYYKNFVDRQRISEKDKSDLLETLNQAIIPSLLELQDLMERASFEIGREGGYNFQKEEGILEELINKIETRNFSPIIGVSQSSLKKSQNDNRLKAQAIRKEGDQLKKIAQSFADARGFKNIQEGIDAFLNPLERDIFEKQLQDARNIVNIDPALARSIIERLKQGLLRAIDEQQQNIPLGGVASDFENLVDKMDINQLKALRSSYLMTLGQEVESGDNESIVNLQENLRAIDRRLNQLGFRMGTPSVGSFRMGTPSTESFITVDEPEEEEGKDEEEEEAETKEQEVKPKRGRPKKIKGGSKPKKTYLRSNIGFIDSSDLMNNSGYAI